MKLLYVDNALAIHGGIERVLTDKLNIGGYDLVAYNFATSASF